jgi:hypothetical protein
MARGRKKGSKNKSILKNEAIEIKQDILFNNPKEIKKYIRALKKLKKVCGVGSPERKDFNKQIKDLKNKLIDQTKPEPEKEELIAEILKVDILLGKLDIDLKKFTIKELQKHLDLITKKQGHKYCLE